MHNVEQLSAASNGSVVDDDTVEGASLKVLQETVNSRAAFEAEVEAYWIERLRRSVRGYRRAVIGFAILMVLSAGWAAFATVLAWDRLAPVGLAALDEMRAVAALVETRR